jgi:hypothetical protein
MTSIVSGALVGATPMSERAARALRRGEKAKIEAHLYLYGESAYRSLRRKRLPACRRDTRAPERPSSRLRCDGETVVSTVSNPLSDAPAAFLDERGRRYMPVCLVATVDGRARYAGIAVLVDPEKHGYQTDVSLASALGAHLIDIGDSLGVAADDGPE